MRIDSHHSFSERYPLAHLGTILGRNRFDGSVLIAEDPSAATCEFVRGIVIRDDLSDYRRLDAWQRDARFRGVCCTLSNRVANGLAELEQRGLTLDVLGGLDLIPQIVARFPRLRIVIDHLGSPGSDAWAGDLERAAECPLVCCKLSGLTGIQPSPQPYVRHALSIFGPRRLMFGSDWPAWLPETTWKAALATFTQAIGAQAIETREELLGGTAERFYAL